jgi:hypothetical protein
MLLALLIAGGLIGFVIFLIKSGQSGPASGTSAGQEQVDSSTRSEQPAKPRRKKKRRTETTDNETNTRSTPTPETPPREELYDELGSDVGQYGERPARKGEQWGLWRKNRWMVLPVYDHIEVFREGRARVTVNGNSYDIDRNGNRVR